MITTVIFTKATNITISCLQKGHHIEEKQAMTKTLLRNAEMLKILKYICKKRIEK